MNGLLSLCMIVKNEDKVLDRCLASVKSLVDEIIIVDTGSTDRTKEIAAKYTDNIYSFEWDSDFAAARNESIRHALGRWILILDADEYVQPTGHDKLRQYLEENRNDQPCGLILSVMNYGGSGHDESNVTESTGARLFINNHSIRYIEPIHEQLTSDYGTPLFTPYPFVIHHTGYTTQVVREKNKSERNLSILEKMNKGDQLNSPYFCFVLGNEYASANREDDALDVYRRSLDQSKPSDTWYFHLLERLVTIEMKKHNFSKAHKNIQNAIKLIPDRTDFRCMEGILYETLGLWNAAEEIFKQCILIAEQAEKKSIPYWIIQPSYGKIVPHQSIAEIRRRKGDIAGAIRHWVITLQLQPKNYVVLQRLMDSLLLTESSDQVKNIIEQLYPLKDSMNKVLLHKMALNIGDSQLVSQYALSVEKLGLQLDVNDIVQQELLLRNWTPSRAYHSHNASIEDSLAIATAITQQDISIAQAANGDPTACVAIVKETLLAIDDRQWDYNILTLYVDKFTQMLQLLWRYGYSDLYRDIMEIMANKEIMNLMGDWFFHRGLHEQALELYSILLENEMLGAEGFKNIGIWYINCGSSEEALPFLEAAFQKETVIDVIGLYKENAIQDNYYKFASKYIDRIPGLTQCCFL